MAVCSLAVAGGVGFWLHNNQGQAERVPGEAPKEVSETSSDPLPRAREHTEEERFAVTLSKAPNEATRLKLLDSLVGEKWAKSGASPLQQSMEQGESAALRQKAFDVACCLAEREGSAATPALMKKAMNSRHSDVRARCIERIRLHPQIELLDELLQAARGGGDERYMAVHALSAFDEPRAQQGVLHAARDEHIPKAERARAIALLARSKLPEAVEYLKELAAEKDGEFASFAIAALAAIQKASASGK